MSQSENKNVALNRYSLRTLVTSAAPLRKGLMSIKSQWFDVTLFLDMMFEVTKSPKTQ